MPADLSSISQISIYLKTPHLAEKVNEVAFFHPLEQKERQESALLFREKKWSFQKEIDFPRRVLLNLQSFLFQNLRILIPLGRRTPEAKFKTILATLFSTSLSREFLLGTEEKRLRFFEAAKKGAESIGYEGFNLLTSLQDPLHYAREMSWIKGQKKSLLDDPVQLQLQLSTLRLEERDEILFQILNHLERPPLSSIVEVETLPHENFQLELKTIYGKVHVNHIDSLTGKVSFTLEKNKTASKIREKHGLLHQRKVLCDQSLLSAYCGKMNSKLNVLEEILFLFDEKEIRDVSLSSHPGEGEKITIVFTSLYSWNEYGEILDQHESIDELQGKQLTITYEDGETKHLILNLLHQNIPLNIWNRLPVPAEMKSHLDDLNDEFLLQLTAIIFNELKLKELPFLQKIGEARMCPFFERKKRVLEGIDLYRQKKEEIVALLSEQKDEGSIIMKALLLKQNKDGEKLKGIDILIYTQVLLRKLRIFHNTNGTAGETRLAGASAAEKAGFAFEKIQETPFLPGRDQNDEEGLFKVLYSMYYFWEEAELDPGLFEEQLAHQSDLKNPETNRYLIH